MREIARAQFRNETGFLIGVDGSYARREATGASDVDMFFLAVKPAVLPLNEVCERKVTFEALLDDNLTIKLPASEGVFDKPLAVDEICEIGGLKDKNVMITRRMLLLLEGLQPHEGDGAMLQGRTLRSNAGAFRNGTSYDSRASIIGTWRWTRYQIDPAAAHFGEFTSDPGGYE